MFDYRAVVTTPLIPSTHIVSEHRIAADHATIALFKGKYLVARWVGFSSYYQIADEDLTNPVSIRWIDSSRPLQRPPSRACSFLYLQRWPSRHVPIASRVHTSLASSRMTRKAWNDHASIGGDDEMIGLLCTVLIPNQEAVLHHQQFLLTLEG